MVQSFAIAQGAGMLLSGEFSIDVLTLVLGSRKDAEDAAWRAKTAKADRETADKLGY